ncbi:hypothetical protein R3P38DRAFT_3190280 [Favolaschia claudopus]|uniref:Uncharacterized protein n=1 Tax=Favolaschia claudopus TaxID=2862362 RepID=A0AAW0BR24_9AGAR
MLSKESTNAVVQLPSETHTPQSCEPDILSQVTSEITDVCDPVASLPLEISSEIFTHCVPHPNERRGTLSEPLLFLGTLPCLPENSGQTSTSTFRPTSAANTRRFWRNGLRGQGQTYYTYLEFSGSPYPAPDILRVVAGHAHHLRELVVPSLVYLDSGLFSPDSVVPLLEVLRVPYSYVENEVHLSSSRVAGILQSAPRLRMLDLSHRDISGPRVTPPVLHECLTSLLITDSMTFDSSSPSILDSLTLPSLRHLEVMSHWESARHIDVLLSFLARSSPLLHSLVLNAGKDNWNPESLEGILRLLPHLHSLRLLGHPRIQDEFLRILGQDHSVLPDLTAFSFARPGIWSKARWYPRLGRVLSARASTLRSFSLDFGTTVQAAHFIDPAQMMSVDSRHIFQELMQGGMQINL